MNTEQNMNTVADAIRDIQQAFGRGLIREARIHIISDGVDYILCYNGHEVWTTDAEGNVFGIASPASHLHAEVERLVGGDVHVTVSAYWCDRRTATVEVVDYHEHGDTVSGIAVETSAGEEVDLREFIARGCMSPREVE